MGVNLSFLSLRRGIRWIYPYPIGPTKLTRPVFIVGCERSGTTILGQMLGQHPQLAYLNEPRHIWFHEPRTDIWSKEARLRKGQLQLTSSDVKPRVASRIARAFADRVRLQKSQRLVEKLPINSFRIGFICGVFPDALFVHLIRNGIDVAHSIATEFSRRYGHVGYKWELLADCARKRGEGQLVDLCTDNVLRGLLEWYLSVSTSSEAVGNLPKDRVLEIRYEDLLRDPVYICNLLENFIGVEPSPTMREFALSRIVRMSPPVATGSLTPAMKMIAGDLLTRLGYL
jgi:hypothetical protein